MAGKIVIFSTNYLYSNLMVKEFLLKNKKIDVIAIIQPKKIFKSKNPLVASYYLFRRVGYLYFSSHLSRHFLFTVGKLITYLINMPKEFVLYPYRKIAKSCEIDMLEVDNLNDKKIVKYLRDNKVDIGVSLLCNQIFDKDLLDSCRLGIIGFHPSNLPEYRGSNPIFWQLVNNEKSIGSTIFKLSSIIDNGDILRQMNIQILPNDTENSLYLKASLQGANAMLQIVGDLLEGSKTEFIYHGEGKSSYYGIPYHEDVVKFKSSNKKFFKLREFF